MDSNGCKKLGIEKGFAKDQLEWLSGEAKKIREEHGEAPAFMCFHIPTDDFSDAYIAKGYQKKADEKGNMTELTLDGDGDFGNKCEPLIPMGLRVLPLAKECSVDGIFVGHCHITNTSVLHDGVRFTFGLKTGLYDYYDPDAIGGTLITLDGGDFTVRHIYYSLGEDFEVRM